MLYLLSRASRAILKRLAQERTLCAFDFDGTLSPIVDHPGEAVMADRTLSLLARLAALYPCVIVSGRGRADLLGRLRGVKAARVIGNHGAETEATPRKPERRLERWKASLALELGALPGVWVEDKGLSLAVHYRQSPQETEARRQIPEAEADQAAMRRVVKKRQDKMRAFFDSVAGRLGKDYVPGRSWKGMAEALLRLMPPMVIADLGAGEGAFALLLAGSATKVIAVDSSAKMIEVGREQALRHGVKNVEYRQGDMEELPIEDGSVDLVFFSQSLHHALHPERAVGEAHRILVSGGRIVVLDLAKHRFEEAREIYADEWLGFSESELENLLENAGFTQVQTSVVHKESETPHFQTLLAVGHKREFAGSK